MPEDANLSTCFTFTTESPIHSRGGTVYLSPETSLGSLSPYWRRQSRQSWRWRQSPNGDCLRTVSVVYKSHLSTRRINVHSQLSTLSFARGASLSGSVARPHPTTSRVRLTDVLLSNSLRPATIARVGGGGGGGGGSGGGDGGGGGKMFRVADIAATAAELRLAVELGR